MRWGWAKNPKSVVGATETRAIVLRTTTTTIVKQTITETTSTAIAMIAIITIVLRPIILRTTTTTIAPMGEMARATIATAIEEERPQKADESRKATRTKTLESGKAGGLAR